MARKKLILTDEFPYHLANRANNREFFYVDLETLWLICLEQLRAIEIRFGCLVHAFVLMGNHFHLLMSTPNANLGEAMKYFEREVARNANKAAGRINHFFGGRYGWSVIGHENYYWNVVKYVFRNPVRAGICQQVSDYPFSSLNRDTHLINWKMIDYFSGSTQNIVLEHEWLNEPFLKEHEEAIKRGLRRKEFKLPSKRSRGKIVLPTLNQLRDLSPKTDKPFSLKFSDESLSSPTKEAARNKK